MDGEESPRAMKACELYRSDIGSQAFCVGLKKASFVKGCFLGHISCGEDAIMIQTGEIIVPISIKKTEYRLWVYICQYSRLNKGLCTVLW